MAKEVGFEQRSVKGATGHKHMEIQTTRRPLLGRILLFLVPLLIIAGFLIATRIMVKAFDKPKEKETKLSKKEQAILAEFKTMDLLDMTPIQVMNELYRLQKKLK